MTEITPEAIARLRRLVVCLPGALRIARQNARSCGDGADGDSIRLVCDVANALPSLLDRIEELEREDDAHHRLLVTQHERTQALQQHLLGAVDYWEDLGKLATRALDRIVELERLPEGREGLRDLLRDTAHELDRMLSLWKLTRTREGPAFDLGIEQLAKVHRALGSSTITASLLPAFDRALAALPDPPPGDSDSAGGHHRGRQPS